MSSLAISAAPSYAASQAFMESFSPQISDPLVSDLQKSTPATAYVEIIKEIAAKYSFRYGFKDSFENRNNTGDWAIKLTRDEKTIRIFGYNLGLNTSEAAEICNDKVATGNYLEDIPHIHHKLFSKRHKDKGPDLEISAELRGEIFAFAKEYNYNIVCKPNSGSGGVDVTHTKTPDELEKTVRKLFSKYPNFVLSPFQEIKHEYRVIMLNNNPEIIYRKNRPYITGDGKSTIQRLLTEINKTTNRSKELNAPPSKWPVELNLTDVPPAGKVVYLNWKHNLCEGATSEFLDHTVDLPIDSSTKKQAEPLAANAVPDQEKMSSIDFTKKLIALAKKAVEAVGITLASVDIVLIQEGPKTVMKIMEINSKVVMKNMMKEHKEEGLRRAQALIEKILCIRMEVPMQNK
jgi:glutathione synthase/RimK-type ligase-like ATP-grasp enzyme